MTSELRLSTRTTKGTCLMTTVSYLGSETLKAETLAPLGPLGPLGSLHEKSGRQMLPTNSSDSSGSFRSP